MFSIKVREAHPIRMLKAYIRLWPDFVGLLQVDTHNLTRLLLRRHRS